MGSSIVIFAYLGPETVLPVTSAIAGALGVIMLLGKSTLRRGIQMARGFIGLFQTRPESRARPSRKIGTGPMNRVERQKSNRTDA